MVDSVKGHKSLIRTLTWGLTLPTLVMIIIAIAVLTHRLSGTVKGLRQATLSSQANEVISHLSSDAGGTLALRLPEHLQNLYKQLNDFSFVILDHSGVPLLASHKLSALGSIDASQSKDSIAYFRVTGNRCAERRSRFGRCKSCSIQVVSCALYDPN